MIRLSPVYQNHLTYPIVVSLSGGGHKIVELSGHDINSDQLPDLGPPVREITARAIDSILTAMLKLQNDNYAPMSADTHLAETVVLLNVLAGITALPDDEYQEQLNYCNELVRLNKGTV